MFTVCTWKIIETGGNLKSKIVPQKSSRKKCSRVLPTMTSKDFIFRKVLQSISLPVNLLDKGQDVEEA